MEFKIRFIKSVAFVVLINITEGTVKNMVSTLLLKYNLQDRTQIAVFGIKNNVL